MLTIVDDRNLGWSLGASEYMTKPIDRERLVALVGRFTSRNADAVVLIVDDDRKSETWSARRYAMPGPQDRRGGQWPGGVDGWPQSSPDLVLLDLMMAEMDGFQFLERMRDTRIGSSSPSLC